MAEEHFDLPQWGQFGNSSARSVVRCRLNPIYEDIMERDWNDEIKAPGSSFQRPAERS